MFYGPGNGEAGINWTVFQGQYQTELAIEAGISQETIRNYLVIPLGDRGRLNFSGLTRAYAERQVRRRIKAYTAIITLQYGVPFVTRQIAWMRYQRAYAPLDIAAKGAARKIATKEAIEFGAFRLLARRAPVRVISRVVPYVGWGLAAWDIYTITFRGELWGVQIYEKNQ
ncbi:hypothetical protein [Poseidonia sp.]|uniref:hypothetical protein n=1 Tax=Poseidonia sp. TaxID=2666344 RepID=UPI003F6A3A68